MLLQFLKTAGVLAGVVGLIFLLAHFARRFGIPGSTLGTQKEGWRLLGVKTMGPRRHVYALEIGSKIVIVGVSDKSMTTIMNVDDPSECDRIRDAVAPRKRQLASFSDLLKRAES